MSSAIETAIRGTITKGLTTVAGFNRARAKTTTPHPYLTGIHTPMTSELTLQTLPVIGEIPAFLDGRYLRIGPNPAGRPNPARYHWFTGDGMVHGLRIANGQALWYRNRWVRTTAVSNALHEPPAPGPRIAEIAVNTNVIGHAGRFYALVEAAGTPVELDETLATLAHNPFDGTLDGTYSAHPHRDPQSGELHAICYDYSDQAKVRHVVVGANGQVRRQEPIAVHHGPSIHDCAITEKFVLVFDLPVTFSMPAMLAGYEFPFRWNADHPARVGLLGREAAGETIIWCAVDPCYVYHPCNAFDAPDGTVVVDVSVHNRNGYRDFRGPDAEDIRLERWTIDPARKTVTRAVIDPTPQEFPRCDERRTGLPYRYAYSVGIDVPIPRAEPLYRHDLHTGAILRHDFGPHHLPGEAVFVPRHADAAEDDGWLLCFVYDLASGTSTLTVLDAANLDGEPAAMVALPARVPLGFHGNWIADEDAIGVSTEPK